MFRVISGGPIITRSVYASKNWYGSESYTLYEPCEETRGERVFNAYSLADDDEYDYIYYEIITEEDAYITWQE